MPDADIGYGTLFKVRTSTGPTVYTAIGEQTNVTPFGISVDAIDATHGQSPGSWREFIPGLKDGGEASFEIQYVPGGSAEALLLSLLGTTAVCRTVYPSGAYADYSAIITAMEPEAPVDDKMVMSITAKITGAPSVTAASAPVNSVEPAIAGASIQVGVELTAWEGVWTAEPTSFTYVWKNAGVAISGATARAYTPVVGDVGDTLTVTVTGTNSAGSASATSAPASAVLAA